MLPMIMRLKIYEEEKRNINLYLPLFLIYLLLLPLLIVALPFVLLWYLWTAERPSLEIIPAVLALMSAVSGTEIEVKSDRTEVILKFL